MRLYLRRIGNAFFADGDEANTEMEKLPQNKPLQADITQPRNLNHHRLFWAMCARIGTGIGQPADWVERAFKVEMGLFDVFKYGGRELPVLRSIAFSKMDQTEFSEFFERAVAIAYDRWQIPPESLAALLTPEEAHAR